MESGTLRDLGRPVSPYISETQMESRETDMGEKSRHYFLLLLLFSASGCAALIYEVVWYQLLQLAIGSTSVSLGILLATFMGGLCIGSLGLPLLRTRQHPLRGLCGPGIRDRHLRDPRAVRPSLPESGLHQRRGAWFAGNDPTCPAGRNLHTAADDSDGRFAPGDRPVDQEDAGRNFLVGLSLRRQHGRRSVRVPCGGILPATDLQYCDGDLVCSCDEHCRGGRQLADGAACSCG